MYKLKIIHYSPTPLVGSPSKIVTMLESLGCEAFWIISSDYPKNGPLYNKFSSNAFILNTLSNFQHIFIEEKIRQADIIHIHNDISSELASWFYSLNSGAKYIYQVHSPLKEGPLYIDRSNYINLPFENKLVVAQYQPRHYQDFVLVPNLILDKPKISIRKDDEKLRVIFSPTHARHGRWNSKYSEVLVKTLRSLVDLNLIDLISVDQPINPILLMSLRQSSHVTIDEIVTGAYHQVSLEGLCAGNIVLNRADFFSKCMLKTVANSDDLPPFYYTDEQNVANNLMKLAMMPAYCRKQQVKSLEYFNNYLRPELLIRKFIEIYNA